MIRATDIHSLTDFTRNAKAYIKKIKDSKCPIALTVNGGAEVVVQDAAAYQEMVDELEHSRFISAMRESERAVREGRVQDVNVAFGEIRSSLGL
jgi:PHD/YefM family antitoxin component YafN of YafNO toxin-antitoxin module